jgi:Na+-transporting methylmalonyl-CoA/oxaloacetate decarboxylase beta subunit
MSVGIIGGADGPTAILVKGGFPIAFIAAAAVLIVIAAIWIGRRGR